MAVMVSKGKNFNNDNSDLAPNSPELSLLKFLSLQPFLGHHFGFHIFTAGLSLTG